VLGSGKSVRIRVTMKRRPSVTRAATVLAVVIVSSAVLPAQDGVGDTAAAANRDATDEHNQSAARGQALYGRYCAACHQADGNGLTGAFPGLKGNAVVNRDDATKHIQVLLHGEPAGRVAGVVYSSPMPAFGEILKDSEVADIINYERSAWGNQGKPVSASQVTAQRSITQ
jgi:mono/diheme cytochrome c family protein